jgi:glutamyl-tRNA reductase
MNFHCTGINHRTAPVGVREQLWFSADETRALIPMLKQHAASECVLTSTCNRTELYCLLRDDASDDNAIWSVLANRKNTDGNVRDSHFYSISSLHAVKHLFRVASGIDSMVVGDVQILNQIKEAFSLAQEIGSVGPVMNRIFTQALHVGKRARTETAIGEGAVSISYAAAELASKIFEDLSRRTALLVGAGETGKLTAQHLTSRNLGNLLLANRTRQRAVELANALSGQVVDFDQLQRHLVDVDIIITAIDGSQYLLSADQLRQTMKQRGNTPLFIIDIGVPRNIDPAANTIENIFLNDIDSLKQIIDKNLEHRLLEVQKVDRIVLDELVKFNSWYQSLQVTPTIQELREQFEAIRSAEVENHRHQFAPDKQETVDLLTKRIVNKILHTPMVNLKNGMGTHGGNTMREKIHLLRHLFGLDKGSSV